MAFRAKEAACGVPTWPHGSAGEVAYVGAGTDDKPIKLFYAGTGQEGRYVVRVLGNSSQNQNLRQAHPCGGVCLQDAAGTPDDPYHSSWEGAHER